MIKLIYYMEKEECLWVKVASTLLWIKSNGLQAK